MENRRRWLTQTIGALASSPLWAEGRADGATSPPGQSGSLADLPLNGAVARVVAEAQTARRWAPGMIAAILRGDRMLGIAARGVRKLGSPTPIEINDQVHLGSCAKAMTATLIAALVDAGRLRWDSTLGSVFAEVAGAIHPGYQRVTLDQLLRHTAGLPANVEFFAYGANRSPTQGRQAILLGALRDAPRTAPGSTYVYSNVGYCLVGLMAEQVTGSAWETLIRQVVFGPLGMTSPGFGPPGSPRTVEQPWGHQFVGLVYLPKWLDNAPVMGPAGTVHMTMADWGKFASFHLGDGSTPGGRRLISRAAMTHLHRPEPGKEYAAGWLVTPRRAWADGPLWVHDGSNTYWYASILLAPARQFIALVACNGAGKLAEAATAAVIDGLARLEPTTRAAARPGATEPLRD